ncbi:hypothetical protein [Nocardioides zeae]|uniref:MFS family permease n=1 Tax=Nocardioides zeae TaxID=1457234 RepID=A0AAJ1TXE4_9ACTN|nr:hypothetical protein [Nocardioides zeae]MDQ1103760.1 MFS family permease [Nocardioides zeae]
MSAASNALIPRGRALLVVQGVAAVASQSYLIVLATLVVPTWGVGAFGLIYALDTASRTAVLLASGFILAQFSERRVLVVSDLLRAVGFAGLAAVAFTQGATDGNVTTVAALCVLVAVGSTTPMSVVPAQLLAHAPSDQPPKSTLASWRVVATCARVAGPAAAALLVPVLGGGWILALLAGVCASAAGVDAYATVDRRASREQLWREATAGLSFVRRDRALLALFVVDVVHVLVPVSVWLILVQSPHILGIDEAQQGWIIASFGAGAFLGVVLARAWGPRRLLTAAAWSGCGIGLPLAGVLLDLPLPGLIVAAALAGVTTETTSLWTHSYIAERAPSDLVSRVLSVNMLVTIGTMPVGFLIAGQALEHARPAHVIATAIAILLVSTFVATPFLLAREARREGQEMKERAG